MRSIQLSSRSNEDWLGKFIDDTAYDELLNESAVVYKPDGSILLVLLKGALSKPAIGAAWSVLKKYNVKTNNRGHAAGTGYIQNVKEDGTVSKTRRAPKEGEVNSGIVGFFERTPRFPYCRACSWNQEDPARFAKLFPMCEEVSELFRQHGGEKYQRQADACAKTHPDFMIPGTVFSTLTINKNFRTACHKDAGNLKDTLNVMCLFREGAFTGGNITFPDFRVAAKLETGDVIIFDAHEFHGNTPIVQMSSQFTRCTVVFYYREKMIHCKSAIEELDRVKNRKAGEALTDGFEE